ncbi:DUF3106 domain-containing protein [Lysobacter antibioticus]|uniref:DUF3106 domain-containing protein n=1 Tax=Lysobacter antibioticus TaxID=84531 RepID=UPI0007172DED|nr:DUF3106 domain-containing protein [Lysobacter antibioticus]
MRRSDSPRRWICGLALAAVAVLTPAAAVPPDLGEILQRLPPSVQARLQENAKRWAGWSPDQRRDFNHSAAQWDALSAAQRGERRERYLAWQALSAQERAQAQAAAARYAALPPDQQLALRAQFDAIDRSDRRGWLLGPALGADYPALQPLLAQMPEAQHGAMREALRAMTPMQRKDLAVLVQRTPPHDRQRLRSGLLATPAPNRGAWLSEELQR